MKTQLSATQPGYHSFLMRVWIVEGTHDSECYISLTTIADGAHCSFAGIDQLMRYLRETPPPERCLPYEVGQQ